MPSADAVATPLQIGDGDRADQPWQLAQLKPLAGGLRPGGSSGTSIVQPSSIG